MIARTSVVPELGVVCAGCDLPRIAADWRMPPPIARTLKRAVRARRAGSRTTVAAFLVASVCVPLGPVLLERFGFSAWGACLLLWFCVLAVAASARGASRRRLARALAIAEQEWKRQRQVARLEAPRETTQPRVASGSEEDGADAVAVEATTTASAKRS